MPDLICKKCGREIPEDAVLCCYCGQPAAPRSRKTKSRGNGQGSVYQLPNKRYIAVKTIGYYTDETGRIHRKTVSKRFDRKKDAVAALPALGAEYTPEWKREKKAKTTFKELYDLWLPTHRAGPSTIQNYKSAMKYFAPIYNVAAADVEIDDLQECLDECPYGKPTRRNMKTTAGLIYKYGLPRGYFPEKLNLADYLSVSGEDGARGQGFPLDVLEAIRQAVGHVKGADMVYCQCYLGFRPSEFLALNAEDYDAEKHTFTGGAKTAAGRNRIVTISPKIQTIIDALTADVSSGPIFRAENGDRMSLGVYRDRFYAVLDAIGVENPLLDKSGGFRHLYTPHSCRHTFATLMKRVAGADKDKLELIGHANNEQLRYYQDVELADLRRITDAI